MGNVPGLWHSQKDQTGTLRERHCLSPRWGQRRAVWAPVLAEGQQCMGAVYLLAVTVVLRVSPEGLALVLALSLGGYVWGGGMGGRTGHRAAS